LKEAAFFEPRYQPLRMEVNDSVIIQLLSERNEKAFEKVFKTHFRNLLAYACTMLREEAAAEEVVQNVFYKLWERNEQLTISGSVNAYLYRAVHNESLNYLKHKKVVSIHQSQSHNHMKGHTDSASKRILLKELEVKLHHALNDLPEQCRIIFQMSRFEELKYREIADKLDISIKTVENQMGKALKLLRVKLADFLPFIIISLFQL
jgi:RNA polymerase sigma-70 factor (ECF subfamily)